MPAPPPVLESIYARVDILELDQTSRSFVRVSSAYLLGDALSLVKTAADVSSKNKKLTSLIGASAVEILADSPVVVTGGDDDWDELDEMNDDEFDDLLNAEDAPIVPTAASARALSAEIFSDLVLSTADKAQDIREKIATVAKIAPYKQFLWVSEARATLDGGRVSLMSHWHSSARIIEGYPVDGFADVAKPPPGDLRSLTAHSAVVLTCISVDSIIQSKERLRFIAKSDSDSYEMIYTNSIKQFFPMISQTILSQYLLDERVVGERFPECAFDAAEMRKTYKARMVLLKRLDKQSRVTLDTVALLNTFAVGVMLVSMRYVQRECVDTVRIFQQFNLPSFPTIASVDLYYYRGKAGAVRLRKISQKNQFLQNAQGASSPADLYASGRMPLMRVLVLTFQARSEFDTLQIIMDRNGTVWIRCEPNPIYSLSKVELLVLITPLVDAVLTNINDMHYAFFDPERCALLRSGTYALPLSSTKIMFNTPVSYSKLVDVFMETLEVAGLIRIRRDTDAPSRSVSTSFVISYGVSHTIGTRRALSSLEIRDRAGIAELLLSNLNFGETELYVDIIGRLVHLSTATLAATLNSQSRLALVDPVLFRAKNAKRGYSRICQSRFQPVVAKASDPKATKYINFTFKRPEYYKCPTAYAPYLGFIKNKHEQGYCLPCCRKTASSSIGSIINACAKNIDTDDAEGSSYKIDFPIASIPNNKIVMRRINLPTYVVRLFDIPSGIINGLVIDNQALDWEVESVSQTATLISMVGYRGARRYLSYRELLLDIIAAIKQPFAQANIMRNAVIIGRYVTPQEIIHDLENTFMRTVVGHESRLSGAEWNDLIVFLANRIGLNVLLLEDDRSGKGVQLRNLPDVDTTRPVLLLFKRLNTEWSSRQQDSRAMYLPVTLSNFKCMKKSELILPRMDISASLKRIGRASPQSAATILEKHITVDNLRDFCQDSKTYQIVDVVEDQKIAIIKVNRRILLTTLITTSITFMPRRIEATPTATLRDLLSFIEEYNSYFLEELPDIKRTLTSYKSYLKTAVTVLPRGYELIASSTHLIKIQSIAVVGEHAIGVVVELVDVARVVSTELMFFAPTPLKSMRGEFAKLEKELGVLQAQVNVRGVLCFPLRARSFTSTGKFPIPTTTWLNNPLSTTPPSTACKADLQHALTVGLYSSSIYPCLTRAIIAKWSTQRLAEFDAVVDKQIRSFGPPPFADSKIETMIETLCRQYPYLDPGVMQLTFTAFLEKINSITRSAGDAAEEFARDPAFDGFELRNLHRYARSEIQDRVAHFMNELTTKSKTYPKINTDDSVAQQVTDSKTGRVLIHESMYSDLAEMLVADLSNPMRRDYIINLPLIDASVIDIQPNIGELVFVTKTTKNI